MRYLIFDTETTGLIKKDDFGVKTYPHVVQLSWVLYNDQMNDVEIERDRIILLPEGMEVPEETIAIHGITTEKMRTEGVEPTLVIDEFIEDLSKCDMIIGHNVDFDKSIMFEEFKRNKKFDYRLGQRPVYCTMTMGKNVCKIERKNKNTGEIYYKKPKLTELHEHLFKETPANLHNSLIDVLVTCRCFGKLYLNRDILENNVPLKNHFTQLCSL
uniref:Exonuclease domain-containing protein n=1 Tax=viral metagenome TaxID=1070528 RepID=A0A6C0C3F5_9ZZZZ